MLKYCWFVRVYFSTASHLETSVTYYVVCALRFLAYKLLLEQERKPNPFLFLRKCSRATDVERFVEVLASYMSSMNSYRRRAGGLHERLLHFSCSFFLSAIGHLLKAARAIKHMLAPALATAYCGRENLLLSSTPRLRLSVHPPVFYSLHYLTRETNKQIKKRELYARAALKGPKWH